MDVYTNMKFDFVFRAFCILNLMVVRADIAADSSMIDGEDFFNELHVPQKSSRKSC